MDPLYRPFFAHVWAICWPFLWWNLVRLTAWRRRTGRTVFVTVDKFGNVRISIVGDVARPRTLPEWKPRWASLALAGGLPCGAAVPALAPSGPGRAHPDTLRAIYGPYPDHSPAARAPP